MNNQKAYWAYASKEMKFMRWFHDFKAKIFHPFNVIFTKLWISANMISIFSWALILISLIYSIYSQQPIYFIIGIWVHFFLDWLDGTLARYQQPHSLRWSLIDTIFDFVGIICTSVFMLYFVDIDSIRILLYTVFYVIIIYHAFVLSKIDMPYSLLIRPRLYIFIWLTIDFIWSLSSTYYIVIISTILMFYYTILWLFKLKLYLQNKKW